jgi:hypothetical protein
MRALYPIIILLLSILEGAAQTRSEIADRKIKQLITISTDSRKEPVQVKKTLTIYDRKGRPLEIKEWEKDSSLTAWEKFQYDSKGKVLFQQTFSADGSIQEETAYEYDRLGALVRKTLNDAKRERKEITEYQYNPQGDKTAETVKDEKGIVSRKTVFEYDNKGMLISRRTFNSEGKLIQDRTISITY